MSLFSCYVTFGMLLETQRK